MMRPLYLGLFLGMVLVLIISLLIGCGNHHRPVHPINTQLTPIRFIPVPIARPTFQNIRGDLLVCARCHVNGGQGAGRFVLTSSNLNPLTVSDYVTIMMFVDMGFPTRSSLLEKASGMNHVGGRIWDTGSDSYVRVADWISQGATYQ